jgi:hypothetical protein
MEQFDPINQWLWFAVQLVKTLAWPVVAALAAWFWRPPIGELLKSFSKRKMAVEALGAKLSLEAAEKQQTETGNPAIPVPAVALLPEARAAVASIEREIQATLDAANVEPAQQRGQLIRALAEARVHGSHEWVYNRIFGSQIAALRALNSRGIVTVSDANQFFDGYLEKYPIHHGNFEPWLSFLLNSGLVERVGALGLRTTALGRDFLVYLTEMGLTDEKQW